LTPDRIYHGQFGRGLFQTIYRHNDYGLWACLTSLEWHLAALFLLLLASMFWPLAFISLAMEAATLVRGLQGAWSAPLPTGIPRRCRLIVAYLYVMQPIWRGWHRLTHLLKCKKLPRLAGSTRMRRQVVKRIASDTRELYWDRRDGWGRGELLAALVRRGRELGWAGDYDNAWSAWDVKLVGDPLHDLAIVTATEELGWPRRFTRVRVQIRTTVFARVLAGGLCTFSAVALAMASMGGLAAALVAGLLLWVCMIRSRRHGLEEAVALVWHAAIQSRRAFREARSARKPRRAEPRGEEQEALAKAPHPAAVRERKQPALLGRGR
jgi:hypothetical protein